MKQSQIGSSKAEQFSWGVEIECFIPERAVNELGIRIGSYHAGCPLPQPFPAGWTAERDGSLRSDRRGYVPVEIVSPILQGRAGIEQVKQVAQTLKNLGARVNPSCGFHTHIGGRSVVGPDDAAVAEWAAKLLYQTAMHETALYASTGTHRRENGSYARTVKAQKRTADRVRRAPKPRKPEVLRDAIYGMGRYHALNLTNLFSHKPTAEFRWAAGTVEAVKTVGHICTCLALAERATETTKMDWEAVATERTYQRQGQGMRELERFFYLTGWIKGRRHVHKPEVQMAGWIADMADLEPVKRELRRLARRYDEWAI